MPTKILFTVLNWGLGHASRSIPIIKHLITAKIELIIASDGDALLLLQKEFPHQIFETLPAYNIKYSKNAKDFDKTIFLQLSRLGKIIQEENLVCKKLIVKHNITHIISDNRYGCYQKNIPSAIICHQLTLQHKNFLSKKIMNEVHFKLLNKFDEIWIPDYKENNLAGEISKTKNKKLLQKIKHIGALSRLKNEHLEKKYDFAIILSGPEPQRTILENTLYQQTISLNKKTAFVRGVSSKENHLESTKKVKIFSLLESTQLNKILNQTEIVICRAGYSSIMDLVILNKKAIIIPTLGQTEQEYLARHLKSKNIFLSIKQEKIYLKQDLPTLQKLVATKEKNRETSFKNTIETFCL